MVEMSMPTASSASPETQMSRTAPHPSRMRTNDLVSINDLDLDEIEALFAEAEACKRTLLQDRRRQAKPYSDVLSGRTILTVFFEPSTRTMHAFRMAAAMLGAAAQDFPVERSSVGKGESFLDTLMTIQALGADALVLRHPTTGAARFAADHLEIPVINGGDGTGEHPTQALLDAFTIRECLGKLHGLTVTIVGDIRHSRVARSNILLLTKLGVEVRVVGPPTMLPHPQAFPDIMVTDDLARALRGADVVMALRIQAERQKKPLITSAQAYRRGWGLNAERLQRFCPNALIMHPGPVLRGVELDAGLLESDRALILRQVENGVAIRMAVFKRLLNADGREAWQA